MADQPLDSAPLEAEAGEQDQGEALVVNRSTIYYVITAVSFFIGGYMVAWLLFSSTTSALLDNLNTAVPGAAANAISTAIARLPGLVSGTPVALNARASSANTGAAVQPTPRVVPIQHINISGAPSWGPADAKVTVVEFGDFQCPYCAQFFRYTYPLLRQNYADKIRFVFRNFPLPQHPDAVPAALAAECANEQGKFWEYHDTLYANQADLSSNALIQYAGQVGLDVPKFTQCFQSQKYLSVVSNDVQAAFGYKADVTPTFYVNGQIYEGAYLYNTFQYILNAQLVATGEVQVF
ncbi:MAG: DsbA family protein [Aggregatilineales bacterium]